MLTTKVTSMIREKSICISCVTWYINYKLLAVSTCPPDGSNYCLVPAGLCPPYLSRCILSALRASVSCFTLDLFSRSFGPLSGGGMEFY